MESQSPATTRAPGDYLHDVRVLLAPEGEKALTQAKLAKMMGFTPQYVQRLEKGKAPLQRQHLSLLAKLKVPPDRRDAFMRVLAGLRDAIAVSDPLAALPPELMAATAAPPAAAAHSEAFSDLRSRLEVIDGRLGTSSELLSGLEVQAHALGGKLDALAASSEAQADGLGGKLEAATTRQEGLLDALTGKIEGSSAKLEERLDSLGRKLDTTTTGIDGALGAVSGTLAATAAKVESELGAVRETVEAASASTGRHLGALMGKVEDTSGKLGHTLQLVHAQQGNVDGQLRRLGQAMWGLTGVVALGVTALVLVAWRTPSVTWFYSIERGGPGIHGEMGEPKTGKPVPDRPLPGQARAPCELGEVSLSGGCWVEVANQKPPCLRGFYYQGDKCYMAGAADWRSTPKPQSSPTPE